MDRQRVILYHTSGTTAPDAENMYLGEIAVSHDNDMPKIYTKKNNDEIAEFVDKEYIDEKVDGVYRYVGTTWNRESLPSSTSFPTLKVKSLDSEDSYVHVVYDCIWEDEEAMLLSGFKLKLFPGDSNTKSVWFRNNENWARNEDTNIKIDSIPISEVGYTVNVGPYQSGTTEATIMLGDSFELTKDSMITMDAVIWASEGVDGSIRGNDYTLNPTVFAGLKTLEIGNVYDTLETGMNYAWTGDAWDAIGGRFECLINDNIVSTNHTWSSQKIHDDLIGVYKYVGSTWNEETLPNTDMYLSQSFVKSDISTVSYVNVSFECIWYEPNVLSGLVLKLRPGNNYVSDVWIRNAENWERDGFNNIQIDGVSIGEKGFSVEVGEYGKGTNEATITFDSNYNITNDSVLVMNAVIWGAEMVDGEIRDNEYIINNPISMHFKTLEVGNVFDTIETGLNFAWAGEDWDALGAPIDADKIIVKGDSELATKSVQTALEFLDEETNKKSVSIDLFDYQTDDEEEKAEIRKQFLNGEISYIRGDESYNKFRFVKEITDDEIKYGNFNICGIPCDVRTFKKASDTYAQQITCYSFKISYSYADGYETYGEGNSLEHLTKYHHENKWNNYPVNELVLVYGVAPITIEAEDRKFAKEGDLYYKWKFVNNDYLLKMPKWIKCIYNEELNSEAIKDATRKIRKEFNYKEANPSHSTKQYPYVYSGDDSLICRESDWRMGIYCVDEEGGLCDVTRNYTTEALRVIPRHINNALNVQLWRYFLVERYSTLMVNYMPSLSDVMIPATDYEVLRSVLTSIDCPYIFIKYRGTLTHQEHGTLTKGSLLMIHINNFVQLEDNLEFYHIKPELGITFDNPGQLRFFIPVINDMYIGCVVRNLGSHVNSRNVVSDAKFAFEKYGYINTSDENQAKSGLKVVKRYADNEYVHVKRHNQVINPMTMVRHYDCNAVEDEMFKQMLGELAVGEQKSKTLSFSSLVNVLSERGKYVSFVYTYSRNGAYSHVRSYRWKHYFFNRWGNPKLWKKLFNADGEKFYSGNANTDTGEYPVIRQTEFKVSGIYYGSDELKRSIAYDIMTKELSIYSYESQPIEHSYVCSKLGAFDAINHINEHYLYFAIFPSKVVRNHNQYTKTCPEEMGVLIKLTFNPQKNEADRNNFENLIYVCDHLDVTSNEMIDLISDRVECKFVKPIRLSDVKNSHY